MRFLPAGRPERTAVGRMCSGGVRLSGAPGFSVGTSRLRGPADGAAGICAAQRGPGSNVQAATGGREPAGVMYTPAPAGVLGSTRRGGGCLQIAAESQEHVHVGSTENRR